MKLDSDTIAEAAQRIGIKADELAAVLQRGAAVTLPGEIISFTNPRRANGWGWSSRARLISCAASMGRACSSAWRKPGAILSEGVMLDDTPHGTSAVTHQGANGLADFARRTGQGARGAAAKSFTGSSARLPGGLSDRLRAASERLAKEARPAGAHRRPPRTRFARRTRRAEPRLLRRANDPGDGELPSPASTSAITSISSARWRV